MLINKGKTTMSNGKEYSPNAPELMGKTYYVDQNDPAASDDNPGSPDQTFAAIPKAAAGRSFSPLAALARNSAGNCLLHTMNSFHWID